MLKVNVGLSRKLSKDYNSTGFTINIEGEVSAPPNDAEAVVEQVKELYDLAEESLNLQIERSQGEAALASHDAAPSRRFRANGNGRRPANGSNGHGHRSESRSPRRENSESEPATEKQLNYLLTLGKRHRLSTLQLEQQIEELLGEQIGVYDLTKREAASVIDQLTSKEGTRSRR
jgi:hypothetical protein